MAKKSSIEKNNRRAPDGEAVRRSPRAAEGDRRRTRRSRWKSVLPRRSSSREMPRNSSKTRIRNRCEVTGRPRAFYRKHEDVAVSRCANSATRA